MIEAILAGAGRTAGSIGTISARYAGHEEVASLTTPESRDLQATFARMRDAGVEVVALEVSSHSLALHRVHTLRFAVAVFTNLTQDHLDYHGTMEAYAETKARLFREPYLEGTAVLHAADAQCAAFADAARLAGNRVVTFARGAESTADIRTAREKISLSGSQFTICADGGEFPIELPLAGEFQLQNALAAGAATSALGVDWQQIQAGLATCPPVPGRFERVASSDPAVFVDYAHTPDALEAVLGQMRAQVSGKLICVFGCGGDRDRGKRAQMARAACRHSDYVVATQDNPRTEDPEQILADLAHGLSGPHEIVADRRDAIARAVALAALNDVVLIAGKGHENYQILGTQRVPFDDRSEALAALDARGAHA
jgi:UDP-N-acetylmuramoyl-L-alanyl-D-glutamate--2,6-diaminopimelate ligase